MEEFKETLLEGCPASPGLSFGSALILQEEHEIIRERKIEPHEIRSELEKFEKAILQTKEDLLKAKASLCGMGLTVEESLFDVQILALEDDMILQAVKEKLERDLVCVEAVYQNIIRSFIAGLNKVGEDEYLRERAIEIRDVAKRVLKKLKGEEGSLQILDSPRILIADFLMLSDLVSLDLRHVSGIVTEDRSRTSHAVILARSQGIPAIVGIQGILHKVINGQTVLIDGFKGILLVNPSPERIAMIKEKTLPSSYLELSDHKILHQLAESLDGKKVYVSANIEFPEDIPVMTKSGADGIGLYRTEFLFLKANHPPSEEEQYEAYRNAAVHAKPHQVVIRTLDLGADKIVSYLPWRWMEENPVLGSRGIRVSLKEKEMFKTQLRSILRAAVEGNVAVMFPMITDLTEIIAAKEMIEQTKQELFHQGVPFGEIKCGVMIETPSSCLIAEHLAQTVDFFSIGSNDLIQYTLAVDRMNNNVEYLYQPFHPSVLLLIRMAAEAAHRRNIPIGICGEISSDLYLLPFFLAVGIHRLSMGSVFIPRTKKAIRFLDVDKIKNSLSPLWEAKTSKETFEILKMIAQSYLPSCFFEQ
ncbi:phosphoenolpyruvate--protein phosphotransferase [Candidatus Methylacidiphilum fumarolicum]|uniref:Phosphoenolpyruvate-protein phosphotransferase n=2 Tax=Candidatus Methylacidiphilum fumarolicum TaxID=591154 RepID=I0K0Z0_METFB|nr:phosphoenolpyruvate--protein phosphotransferase [Candidatus Methylacidiphilum fumarolicum]MBW6413971.1 phosphoenolpyruvate--protein phosphotransferase [Candidatus Methylacidiphilum fumarolicum]TFE70513.1 phosphoenolpyruvate--protein phosphotransferase [Candidatus Methylacidiphilum fumarolicum]TFE74769.1 phosphoenolpyruvate--protein phosphotransferase [Candidatus Methylacidiphilum fumarolicum]TFE76015.1 phosphoenolpyruvate--protein phosphotransferase [Candidatus Methylacidiphilum fumarolicum]